MRRERVRELLTRVAGGSLPIEGALDALAADPVESLDFASIDHHRALRQGYPEVVYGGGKTVEQVVTIATKIAERSDGVLVTRVATEAVDPLRAALPSGEYNDTARTLLVRPRTPVELTTEAVLFPSPKRPPCARMRWRAASSGSRTSASPESTASSLGATSSTRRA